MFVVIIPVKPYVKRYLVNQCGSDPINLSQLPKFNDLLIHLLTKPDKRRDARITFSHYTEKIEIQISEDIFYRYGWEMTKTNIIKFNSDVESMIKFNARAYIGINHQLGTPVAKCIRNFQDNFNLPEDVMKYDAIKKDWDRHGSSFKGTFFVDLRDKTLKILMDNLSTLGTVSQNFLSYE